MTGPYVALLLLNEQTLTESTTVYLAGELASGLAIKYGGWTPQPSLDNGRTVIETIHLVASGSDPDDMASKIRSIHQFAEAVRQAREGINPYTPWLEWKLDGESKYRWARILDMRASPGVAVFDRYVAANATIPDYVIVIERTGLWEAAENAGVYDHAGTISSVGGAIQLTSVTFGNDVPGDSPARCSGVYFDGDDGLVKYWLGVRTEQYGSSARTSFQATWSLRKASTLGTDTTGGTGHADATCKDGYRAQTNFSTTESLVRRLKIKVEDVTASATAQRGKYKVLLRAKLSSTGEVRVRLADGLPGGSLRTQSRVYINSTSWQFYDLGTVTIPGVRYHTSYDEFFKKYTLAIDAERISGACYLFYDCFVMIPIEDFYLHVDASEASDAASVNGVRVWSYADGIITATCEVANVPSSVAAPEVGGGVAPTTGINVIVAAQGATASVLTEVLGVLLYLRPTYRDLRGGSV